MVGIRVICADETGDSCMSVGINGDWLGLGLMSQLVFHLLAMMLNELLLMECTKRRRS